ncbi:hypothetical protein BsWGS_09996 [Bradybaena similaris]
MASTSHGLSVWANTCVKSPINRNTGLSASLHDRDNLPVKHGGTLREVKDTEDIVSMQGTDVADRSESFAVDGGENSFVTTASITRNSIFDKLKASHDVEFYEKLQQLKEENKKTMEAYERLYHDTISDESVDAEITQGYEYDRSGFDTKATGKVELSVKGIGTNTTSMSQEFVARKPPTGKLRGSTLQTPIPSKMLPRKSTNSLRVQHSVPTERRSHSLDEEYWHQLFFKSGESSDNFTIPVEQDRSSEYEKALAKVDKLWEDFKISEYTQRRHSISSSNHKNKEKSEDTKKEWRHRITIPQPFKMSIRDSLKQKKKTSAQEELEQQRLAKQRQEEAECEKRFKAQPVPAHIYLPKYEEIMERNETRRKYIKQICQELLESQVKPFNFDIREKEKKSQRARSAPIKRPDRTSHSFKAKPVPRHIFSQDIDEKLLEEEELRKIRVRMRSKELLKESSLPPNMAARERLKELERKEKIKKAKLTTKKQRSRSSYGVPDYDSLYKEFKKELERRRLIQTGTFVEPFILETEKINSNKDKIRKDIEEDEKRLKENRWPFQSSRMTPRSSMKYLAALSDSMDYIPTQSTRSAELRSTRVQKEKERTANRQKNYEEAEKRKRAREAKLKHYLSEKISTTDIPKPRDSIAERLKKIRREDRERQAAYEREIEEMNSKVEQSPLLVEKFMAENAKRKAEKKFAATLHNAGLNDREFVSSGISRPASARSGVVNGGDSGDHQRSAADDHHSDYSDDFQGNRSADQRGNDTVVGDGADSQPSNSDLTYTKSVTDE